MHSSLAIYLNQTIETEFFFQHNILATTSIETD